MPNKTWILSHIIRAGYTISNLGRNIEAKKKDEVYRGSINGVHKQIFRY